MAVLTFNDKEFRTYDHLYAVAADGSVLRLLGMTIAKLSQRKDGYLTAGRQRLVHRMVATCWCDRPAGAKLVHHINHDKSDNRAANLEWVSLKEHADKHPAWGRSPMPDSARQKLREYRTGRKTSDATKAKQRNAALRLGCTPPPRPLGFRCSEESKRKMRENSPNASSCEVDGVVYLSYSHAGEVLGIKPHTVRKRCLSDNFTNYRKL